MFDDSDVDSESEVESDEDRGSTYHEDKIDNTVTVEDDTMETKLITGQCTYNR